MKKMEQDENSPGNPGDRYVASIERFIGILLDRLAQSPNGKLMDEQQTRMLGSVLMRAYGQWQKALASRARDSSTREQARRLRIPIPESNETE